MLKVITDPVELRGIANKTSNKGSVYYVVNVETDDGTPHAMYCPSGEAFPPGLKKGDLVQLQMEVKRFKDNERLIVNKVDKVG